MKLIIDIPEEKYKTIQEGMYCGMLDADLYRDIKNGTPLDDLRAEIDEIQLSEPIMSVDGLTCYGSKSISIRYFREKVLEIIDRYRNEVNE